MELTDDLLIQWGEEIKEARLASGLDNITKGDEVRVILEGDNSCNPVTINAKDIISINEKGRIKNE